jgi:hypothetical protein
MSLDSNRYPIAILSVLIALLVGCGQPSDKLSTHSASLGVSAAAGTAVPVDARTDAPPTTPPRGPGTSEVTDEEVLRAKGCKATCVASKPMTAADIAEMNAAAAAALPDTTIGRSSSNLSIEEAAKFAEIGRSLSERMWRTGTYPADRSDRGSGAVDADERRIGAEVDNIWSSKISAYQKRGWAKNAHEHALRAVGGKALTQGDALLQSSDVLVDGDAFARRVGDVVTVVAKAHVNQTFFDSPGVIRSQDGLWQWTLSFEGGRWTLLKEITPSLLTGI